MTREKLSVYAAALVICGVSHAATLTFVATLTGPGESPPNSSTGTGSALVTYNTVTNMLGVSVSFSGLSSATTASHIHCCVAPPGATGVATAVPTFPGFPLGVTSGTYNASFDLTNASSYNPAFVTASGGVSGAQAALVNGLINDLAYLNIHTTNNPGGEIRGFLVETPEPATAGICAAALAAVCLARRRRPVTTRNAER